MENELIEEWLEHNEVTICPPCLDSLKYFPLDENPNAYIGNVTQIYKDISVKEEIEDYERN